MVTRIRELEMSRSRLQGIGGRPAGAWSRHRHITRPGRRVPPFPLTPSTTHGRHPASRGAPVATTMASSVRCALSISCSSWAIRCSRWAQGIWRIHDSLDLGHQPFNQHIRLKKGHQCVQLRRPLHGGAVGSEPVENLVAPYPAATGPDRDPSHGNGCRTDKTPRPDRVYAAV
jgi:hypothetical protein